MWVVLLFLSLLDARGELGEVVAFDAERAFLHGVVDFLFEPDAVAAFEVDDGVSVADECHDAGLDGAGA